MKENDFKKVISSLAPDASMDQRITEKLIHYEFNTNKANQLLQVDHSFSIKNSLTLIHKLPKIAVAILILVVVGGTTAAAVGYFLKSYPAEYRIVSIKDYDLSTESETIHFGEGHKNVTTTITDAEGNITERTIPEDPNHDDVKYGDEVFQKLELPNLIPTYLFDRYLLTEGGYRYIEHRLSDGTTSAEIAASFFTVGSSKHVYIQFMPCDISADDAVLLVSNDVLKGGYKKSTYTAKNGLICNMIEYDNESIIDATILFDSDKLGNAMYFLCFTDIQKDEAKAILDSIPINATE